MLRTLTLLAAVAVLASASAPAVAQQAPKRRFLQRTVDEWSAQLKSAKAVDRRNAAFALGNFGAFATSTLPMLTRMYGQEQDARAREAMVLAAGEIAADAGMADEQLEAALIEALQHDKDRYVRRSAALALGQIGSKNEKVQAALGQALSEKEQIVRQNAAWALGRTDARAASALVRALRDDSCDSLVKRDAANALYAVGNTDPEVMRPAMDALLKMCADKEPEVRKAGLTPLVQLVSAKDTEAVPVLKAALRDPELEVKRFAAMALSNIGGSAAADAVPILRDALRTGNLQVRRSAAIAMHNIREAAAPAIPELLTALNESDEELRKNAALALGAIGRAAGPAVPALVKIVTDPDVKAEVRKVAALALASMGDLPQLRDQLPQLLAVLGNPREDGDVRTRMTWLLYPAMQKKDREIINTAKPIMERVCAESATKDNAIARYQCGYLLAIEYQTQAPAAALSALQDWLFDSSTVNFSGVQTKGGASGTERQNPGNSTTELTGGDSRVMAVQGLGLIGRERVVAHPEIIEQLRRLADDAKAFPDLRKDCKALLKKLGV
jgi:HEAT repeat protein